MAFGNDDTGANTSNPSDNQPSDSGLKTSNEPVNGVPGSTDTSNNEIPGGNTSGGTTTGKNWEAEYQTLSKTHAQVEKNYAELRRKLVTQGTESNQSKKQLSEMQLQLKALGEALAKATEQPYDSAQFQEELFKQGPKYIEDIFGKKEKALREHYDGQLKERDQRFRKMETSYTVESRRRDTEKFPNFKEMEPTMSDIYLQLKEDFHSGLTDKDPDAVDADKLVDRLYELAKLHHSKDALIAAEADGAAKAKADIARERATSVAGAGKNSQSVTTPLDPNTLKAKDLRSQFDKLGMVDH